MITSGAVNSDFAGFICSHCKFLNVLYRERCCGSLWGGGKGESEQSKERREDKQLTAYIPERYHLTVSEVCH